MATMFVKHSVADFTKWKKAYDGFDSERKSLGVTSHGVYQLEGDPNDVTISHEFSTMAAAKDFAGSARLKEVMGQAGVQGAPTVWFTNRV
jgi:hypothetical protein